MCQNNLVAWENPILIWGHKTNLNIFNMRILLLLCFDCSDNKAVP